ncbi:hypothetical protein [Tenacibaculum sp.]|uniref:hypothetical protein n=1 Tax=Tenacibaculum sp. TaxID=1906242 RepID=UPI003D0F35D7
MTKEDLKNRMVVPHKDSITQFEPFYQITPKELDELNKQYYNEQLKLYGVSQQRELLHKLLQHISDEDELIHNRTHNQIIDDFYKFM